MSDPVAVYGCRMAQGGDDSYKAVERVLSGAVSKVLSQLKNKPSREKQRSTSTDRRHVRQSSSDSSSDDRDDRVQQAPQKKVKSSK